MAAARDDAAPAFSRIPDFLVGVCLLTSLGRQFKPITAPLGSVQRGVDLERLHGENESSHDVIPANRVPLQMKTLIAAVFVVAVCASLSVAREMEKERAKRETPRETKKDPKKEVKRGTKQEVNLAAGHPCQFAPAPNYDLTAAGGTDATDLTDGRITQRADQCIWFEASTVGWTYTPVVNDSGPEEEAGSARDQDRVENLAPGVARPAFGGAGDYLPSVEQGDKACATLRRFRVDAR